MKIYVGIGGIPEPDTNVPAIEKYDNVISVFWLKYSFILDLVHWRASGSVNTNSFISHHIETGHFTFTNEGTYVITLSLTTNTYSDNLHKNYIRVLVCLMFETANGEKSEECRPITHTKIMNIPFQIVKYSELKNGTKISARIDNRSALKSINDHNKLFIVMLWGLKAFYRMIILVKVTCLSTHVSLELIRVLPEKVNQRLWLHLQECSRDYHSRW